MLLLGSYVLHSGAGQVLTRVFQQLVFYKDLLYGNHTTLY